MKEKAKADAGGASVRIPPMKPVCETKRIDALWVKSYAEETSMFEKKKANGGNHDFKECVKKCLRK